MAIGIGSEQPPEDVDVPLKEFLSRQFVQVNIALEQNNDFDVRYVLPAKLRVGKIYYFGAAVATTPITGEGWWGFKSTGWVQLG